jgi:hypothetical protein
MSGYFDRGATAGGHDHGVFNREDVTGPEGVGTGVTGGPGAVANENFDVAGHQPSAEGANRLDSLAHGPYEQAADNPNIVSPAPAGGKLDETAGTSSPVRADEPYEEIIEGSDSERTGTSRSLPGRQRGGDVQAGHALAPEGEQTGQAHPNRNTGSVTSRDELGEVGSWSTIHTHDSAGSPTGNS